MSCPYCTHSNPCITPTPCVTETLCACGGCPVQLDFACVFYHKDTADVTQLDGLHFANGANLEDIIEALDEKIKGLNVSGFSLPYLRTKYTIQTMQQLANAIDTELSLDTASAISTSIGGFLGSLSVTPSALDGQYWHDTVYDKLKFKLNGVVRTVNIT